MNARVTPAHQPGCGQPLGQGMAGLWFKCTRGNFDRRGPSLLAGIGQPHLPNRGVGPEKGTVCPPRPAGPPARPVPGPRPAADGEGVTVDHPGLEEVARWPRRPQLAISLHAPEDERRSALMPINHRYPLDELLATLR